MRNKTEILKWRRLDNSAKLFPLISSKKYSSVFRMSCVLKEKINPTILQRATEIAINRLEYFKVRLKKGFFWYYFEENPKNPIIEEEKNYPCKYINPDTNNQYLFKITYYDTKINMDIFHSLTDGNSAMHLLKEIVYTYLDLKHPQISKTYQRADRKIDYTEEDSYLKNYNKKLKRGKASPKAYIIQGKKLPLDAIRVTHGFVDLARLKEVTKEEGCTVTQFLTAVLFYSIDRGNNKKGNKPIKICIPVNLKKYFNSITMSNFFSYMTLCLAKEKPSFEEILNFVKKEFKEQLSEEEIKKTMSANVKLGNNMLVRLIPLYFKMGVLRVVYEEIRKYTTTTYSNIGRIGIIPEYKSYISTFLFLIAPEKIEKIKCSSCSYEDKMVFTFTSCMQERGIENKFFEILKQKDILVQIEGNGVYDEFISKD